MVRAPVWLSTKHLYVFCVLVLASPAGAWAGPGHVPAGSSESIVAVGDVHGELDEVDADVQRTVVENLASEDVRAGYDVY